MGIFSDICRTPDLFCCCFFFFIQLFLKKTAWICRTVLKTLKIWKWNKPLGQKKTSTTCLFFLTRTSLHYSFVLTGYLEKEKKCLSCWVASHLFQAFVSPVWQQTFPFNFDLFSRAALIYFKHLLLPLISETALKSFHLSSPLRKRPRRRETSRITPRWVRPSRVTVGGATRGGLMGFGEVIWSHLKPEPRGLVTEGAYLWRRRRGCETGTLRERESPPARLLEGIGGRGEKFWREELVADRWFSAGGVPGPASLSGSRDPNYFHSTQIYF